MVGERIGLSGSTILCLSYTKSREDIDILSPCYSPIPVGDDTCNFFLSFLGLVRFGDLVGLDIASGKIHSLSYRYFSSRFEI